MIRRSFLTSTLGAIAGAVCAPFVGKAGGEKYGSPGIQVVDIPDFQPAYFKFPGFDNPSNWPRRCSCGFEEPRSAPYHFMGPNCRYLAPLTQQEQRDA
jgi:hypothetical protein